jgi:hypothetical protein
MNLKEIDRGELIAVVGGILLGISLFLPWFTLGNPNTVLNQCTHPAHFGDPGTSCTGWASLSAIRYLLLIAAVAPLILAYIIVRGHALSWPRGELTAVTALAALTITVFRGLIAKPGSPPGQIGIDYGWGVALIAGLLILTGSIFRARESAGRRKPPGVL